MPAGQGGSTASPNSSAFNSSTLMNALSHAQGGSQGSAPATTIPSNYGGVGYQNSAIPQSFLSGLYQNVLGRAPDAGGMQYWQNQLDSGASPQSVIQGFQSSPEAQRDAAGGQSPGMANAAGLKSLFNPSPQSSGFFQMSPGMNSPNPYAVAPQLQTPYSYPNGLWPQQPQIPQMAPPYNQRALPATAQADNPLSTLTLTPRQNAYLQNLGSGG